MPPGEGSVEDGEFLYEDKCASCHGSFGESVAGYPALAGGDGSLTDPRPKKTVGSYWAHVSTLWDYIHRAMPFTQPESLSDDEVYAITAYVLHLNDIVDYDFVLSDENFLSVELPNAGNFISEERPDTNNVRCMERCKDPASIRITSEAEPYVAEPIASSSNDPGAANEAGRAVYQQYCGLCHESGVGGAPAFADKAEWARRANKGLEILYNNALAGFTGDAGVMPPKGGFVNLDDDAVRSAVDFLLQSTAE